MKRKRNKTWYEARIFSKERLASNDGTFGPWEDNGAVDTLRRDNMRSLFEEVRDDMEHCYGFPRDTTVYDLTDEGIVAVALVDSICNVPSEKELEIWESGEGYLYQSEITIRFTKIKEQDVDVDTLYELLTKENCMWDLETLKKMNAEPVVVEQEDKAEEDTEEEQS